MPPRAETYALSDIPAALALLTRFPLPATAVPPTHSANERGALAAWAWPLAGLATALPALVVGWLAMGLGLPPLIAAALVVVVQVMVTGALHEDGLADSIDGLWGGWDRARRLAIMKDSHIGSYGVIALVLSILIRVAALSVLMRGEDWGWALIATAVTSRAGMTALAGSLPLARPDGLSAGIGRPEPVTVWTAISIALALGILCTGGTLIFLAFWSALVLAIWGWIARARIGGQTGDILGAGQQLAEITALLVLVACA